MDKEKYLKRIGYNGAMDLSGDTLMNLHRQHVFQVPFENLDVYYKRKFDLDLLRLYQKIVVEHRGGFCYEQNLLFNSLLQCIGFTSRIIAARIFNEQGDLGPPFDHMSISVKAEKDFLLDVGYGDLFVTPLEIKEGIQYDGRNYFRIEQKDSDNYILSMSPDNIVYAKRYTFSLSVVQAHCFDSPCLDKQTNPNSYFVQNVICTKPTATGRVTIFNDKLVEKRGELRMITPVEGDENLRELLKDKFGIVIRGDA
ncbi:arylamine N-acetyltransferase [Chryseolinea sp. T2]|uniref:arylamine N-acetyltransferase family protein n=1 Tax=Chryseolinea sp. T2 TaxID=3129255 RepID=UPI003076EED1